MSIVECTKEHPWDRKPVIGSVRHHNAHEIANSQKDGWPAGDTIVMRCENCEHEWLQELPQ